MRPAGTIFLAGALLLTLLSACQTPTSALSKVKPVVSSYPTVPREDAAIIQAVKAELRDPDSAQFGAVMTGVDADGMVWACGTVNAKNSYGGYTGHVAYAGMLGDASDGRRIFAITGMGRAPWDTSDEVVRLYCRKQGLAV